MPFEVPQGEALGCDGCGGVWVDDRAFAALRQGMEDEIMGVGEALAERALPSLGMRVPTRCPICAHALTPTQVSGVRVDFCAAHGTWIDHVEVEAIATGVQLASAGAGPSSWAERLSGDLGVLPAGLVTALGTVIAVGEHARRARRERR